MAFNKICFFHTSLLVIYEYRSLPRSLATFHKTAFLGKNEARLTSVKNPKLEPKKDHGYFAAGESTTEQGSGFWQNSVGSCLLPASVLVRARYIRSDRFNGCHDGGELFELSI